MSERVRLVAVVGAGGKTTALWNLARQTADRRVLLTTTTHIFPEPPPMCRCLLLDPGEEELLHELEKPGIVCAGSRAAEGKMGMLPYSLLSCAVKRAELTLYEADGARRLPLKLHGRYEPVFLPETDRFLVVAGLSALGQPALRVIHRAMRQAAWCGPEETIVGVEEFLYCVEETVKACGQPREKLRVLLNQADTLTRPEEGEQILSALRARGLNCRMGSLREDASFLEEWILS